jgi:hypothetical protein
MILADQLYLCFGIPLMGLFLYYKCASKIPDETVFRLGFLNTFNFLLWFSQLFMIRYRGLSGLHVLGFIYLLLVAPMISLGSSYWLFAHRKTLPHYRYALVTGTAYFLLFWGLPFLLIVAAAMFNRIGWVG